MEFSLSILPIVIIDTDEAISYYENQMTGLGDRFFLQILTSLNTIKENPFAFSFVKTPVRRCLIKKFPYKIYYLIDQATIIIIGIAHVKRSNRFLKKKLGL